jgi:formylglycine-generating enzyme required for sulfatase activity/tRNA A-37 threonylcarbamoyl transferase component Bud32
MSDRSMTNWAGRQLGDYRIIEPIGAGGMGEVFLAEHVHLRKKYAVKVLPEALAGDRQFVARFHDEARVMAELRHPGIVQVHYMGEAEGAYFLVMDYVTGPDGKPESLHDRLGSCEDGRLPEPEARRLAEQVAEALAYAHQRGVVHRDLKPANILLDGEGNAKLTDFGLAKAVGSEFLLSQIHQSMQQTLSTGRTILAPGPAGDTLDVAETLRSPDSPPSRRSSAASSLLGTYDYMAPEQRGEGTGRIDERTDIYAFGVLMYRILTGRRPAGRAKAASQVVPSLSSDWDPVIDRCLEEDPEDRYPSAAALQLDLVKISASRCHALRRIAVVALAVCAAAVLAAAALGLWDASPPEGPAPGGPSTPAGKTPPPTPPETPPLVAPRALACQLSIRPPGATVVLSREGRLVAEQQVGDEQLEVSLDPGTYTVQVTKVGYEPLSQLVTFGADKLAFTAELSPILGELVIRSDPGVTIEATDSAGREIPLGRTDAQGLRRITTLTEGPYTIYMSRAKHQPVSRKVELIAGRPEELEARLIGEPGSIRISSARQAEVWAAGTRLGTTNSVISPLAAGEHTLELRVRGFRTERLTVTIPPAGFVPIEGPAMVAESGDLHITASSVPADTYLAEARAEVRVDRGPWKTVSLPYTEPGLSVGEHRVELQVPGYTVSGQGPISIRDGQTATAAFKLEPEPIRVTIRANVDKAEVLDAAGRRLGIAGESLSLAPFVRHRVTVRAPGYQAAEEIISSTVPGASLRMRVVTLERLREPTVYTSWPFNKSEAESRREETAATLGKPQRLSLDCGRGVKLELASIPAGKFQMGSPSSEPGRFSSEGPQREVTISRSFYMGIHEVTQEQYEAVMGANPSSFQKGKVLKKGGWFSSDEVMGPSDRHPVERVSWPDADDFCKKLSAKTGRRVCLPTEAEWEYACRAGTESRFSFGDSDSSLSDYAWYTGNSGSSTHPVGQKKPNAFGLYDMHGNVWEWCSDWYQDSYSGLSLQDPKGPNNGAYRVLRGGCWFNSPQICRSAYRYGNSPASTGDGNGFRVVVSLD